MGAINIPVEIVRAIVYGIIDLIKSGKRNAEKIAKTDAVDDHSSAGDIDSVMEMFSDYKKQIHGKTAGIEKLLMQEVGAYSEEVKDLLREQHEAIKKYGIRPEKIERAFDRLLSDVPGSIDREVFKAVSLDNSECRQIIKMIPGAKKEEALSRFFKDTMKQALDKFCSNLENALKEFYEEAEEELVGAIEIVRRENEQNAMELAAVDQDNCAEKMLEIQKKTGCVLAVCDVMDAIVEGGEQ